MTINKANEYDNLVMAIKAVDRHLNKAIKPEFKSKKDLLYSIDTVTSDHLRYLLLGFTDLQAETDQELEHIWDKREDIRAMAIDDCLNSSEGANYDDVDGIEEKALELFFMSNPDYYLKGVN